MPDDRDRRDRTPPPPPQPPYPPYPLPVLPELAPEDGAATEAFGGSGQAPAAPVDVDALRERVIATLRTIYDPEIPVNIHELGLIYGLEIGPDGAVDIELTLTAPGCPVAGPLVREVADRVGAVEGVSRSHVTLVWDPPWTMDRMSDEAKLQLGLL